jgi:hypothetical protein
MAKRSTNTSGGRAKGARSREKGAEFERAIAQRMREIYDPPWMVRKLKILAAARQRGAHAELLKQSVVSRGEQSRGAKHPDLLIADCPCWLELQNAGAGHDPVGKLRQAERDVAQAKSQLWPVAVCHKARSPNTRVYMRYRTLRLLEAGDGRLPLPPEMIDMIVLIDFEDFVAILKRYRAM